MPPRKKTENNLVLHSFAGSFALPYLYQMNRSISTFIIFLFICNVCTAQNNKDVQITILPKYKNIDSSYSYRLYGEKAEMLVTRLKQAHPHVRSKKGISRFRCISIPGLDRKVTLKVHEGIETTQGNSSGFNTFYSKKYRLTRTSNIKPNEQLGILVYVIHNSRLNGRDVVHTSEENDKTVAYLESLLLKEVRSEH